MSIALVGVIVQADQGKADHPCHKIRAACEQAGFVKVGHKEKKGLMRDCLHPILEGKTVSGVTVSADEVAACKAKKGQRRK